MAYKRKANPAAVLADVYSDMTLAEVGAKHGITRERVRQIWAAAGVPVKGRRLTIDDDARKAKRAKRGYTPRQFTSVIRRHPRLIGCNWCSRCHLVVRADQMTKGNNRRCKACTADLKLIDYYSGGKERQMEWAKANPEKVAAAQRRYAESNPEKIRAMKKRYYEANPEKVRERWRIASRRAYARRKERQKAGDQ